mmetsp:Transcript_567/g.2269  ORF Transcript_567/g.2269 Transcript_567/m.2269 type:complete len:205 (-) Transcript_567:54-668(-)
MGLNSIITQASTSSLDNTPSVASSSISFRLTFHSWSRPANGPRSITHTFAPRRCNAVAARIPSVPPHTATSNTPVASVAESLAVNASSTRPRRRLVNSGPSSCRRPPPSSARNAAHRPSNARNASTVVCPPAPSARSPPSPRSIDDNSRIVLADTSVSARVGVQCPRARRSRLAPALARAKHIARIAPHAIARVSPRLRRRVAR